MLGLVENMSERYNNVKTVFNALNLNDCCFVLASDLKLINVILGLSVSIIMRITE